MAKIAPLPVWTELDRLCGKCSAHQAESDDWLCYSCRAALESHWVRLTEGSSPNPRAPTRRESRQGEEPSLPPFA